MKLKDNSLKNINTKKVYATSGKMRQFGPALNIGVNERLLKITNRVTGVNNGI